jgi:hypothetical protein
MPRRQKNLRKHRHVPWSVTGMMKAMMKAMLTNV